MPRGAGGRDHGASARRASPRAKLLLVGALGLAAFLVSLLATLPARVAAAYLAPPVRVEAYSGTVWSGRAHLDGGHSIDWRLDLPRSVPALGAVADVTVAGPGTALAGRVTVAGARGADVRVARLFGRVAWPLVAALAPDLPVSCNLAAEVVDVRLDLVPGRRGGSGSLQSDAGTCTDAAGALGPVPVAPLSVQLGTVEAGLRGVLTATDRPDVPLAEATLTNLGALAVTLHPEGAALVPGLAAVAWSREFPWPPPP